jgi:hypothetical protein
MASPGSFGGGSQGRRTTAPGPMTGSPWQQHSTPPCNCFRRRPDDDKITARNVPESAESDLRPVHAAFRPCRCSAQSNPRLPGAFKSTVKPDRCGVNFIVSESAISKEPEVAMASPDWPRINAVVQKFPKHAKLVPLEKISSLSKISLHLFPFHGSACPSLSLRS